LPSPLVFEWHTAQRLKTVAPFVAFPAACAELAARRAATRIVVTRMLIPSIG
jgi:hypothetical protein